jgi:hypothetical protein
MSNTCQHCFRTITTDNDGRWIDPLATGDDSMWRETCDEHDTFTAEHEPIEWDDASASSYTAESAVVNGHTVTVCLDDEGPMRPAFYWEMDDRRTDGWASTIEQARIDAVNTALRWEEGPSAAELAGDYGINGRDRNV